MDPKIGSRFRLTRELHTWGNSTAPAGTKVEYIGKREEEDTPGFKVTYGIYKVTEGNLEGSELKLLPTSEAETSLELLKESIEVYWDSKGRKGGKNGCYRARLHNNHGIHDAGITKEDAVNNLLKTAESLGESGKCEDYEIVNI